MAIVAMLAATGCSTNTDGSDETTLSGGSDESSETGEDLGEICDGEEPGADIIINTPDDLDQFLGIECIPGRLLIDASPPDDSIINLQGMETVKEIGILEIRYNLTIESLEGLNNVGRIGQLIVKGNQVLPNLKGLDSLTHLDSFLLIESNPAMTSLEGLEGISEAGTVDINSNPVLKDFAGLKNLVEVKKLILIDNDTPTNLAGFDNLDTIDGDLEIEENDSMTTLDGLSVIQLVAGTIRIIDNTMLGTCKAREFIESIPDHQGAPVCNDNKVDSCGNDCKN